MRAIAKIGVVVALAFALIQVVPVKRTNPPVTADLEAPAEVKSTLRRSCYDCHSNETRWPWYSRVAPISWLNAHDVAEGRDALNFSNWGAADPARRAKLMKQTAEEVREGEMPPWYYVPLHPRAKLGEADKHAIEDWARSSTATVARSP